MKFFFLLASLACASGMRINPDPIQSINQSLTDVGGDWLWSSDPVYDNTYSQVLTQPISMDAVTLSDIRWFTPSPTLTIRQTSDSNSRVDWSGIAYLLPDLSGGGGSSGVSSFAGRTGPVVPQAGDYYGFYLDSARARSIIYDSLQANSRGWQTTAGHVDSARASHIADSAKVAGRVDSARVSGLSDSAKALVRYARTSALHDTADTLRQRIKDTSATLRTLIAARMPGWSTANVIPKGNGSTGLVSSSITDNGTTIATSEPIQNSSSALSSGSIIGGTAGMGTWYSNSGVAWFGYSGNNQSSSFTSGFYNGSAGGVTVAGSIGTGVAVSTGGNTQIALGHNYTRSKDTLGILDIEGSGSPGHLAIARNGLVTVDSSTSFPPSGAAGGALAGTYPNPSLSWFTANTIPKGNGTTGLTASSLTDNGTTVATTETIRPTGPWSTGQIDIGSTGQAGVVVLRRGTDGAAISQIGYGSAGTGTDFDILSGGTGTIRLSVGVVDALLLDNSQHAHFYGSLSSPGPDTINGAPFPASATIVGTNSSRQIVDASSATLANNTTGSAATLTTTRTFSATGDATAVAQNFNGSANVALPMVVGKINGTLLSGLGTGLLKNTTGTGIPSIAVAADLPGGPYLTSSTGVTSFNTRTGAVVPSSSDYSSFYLPIANPAFTGTLTGPAITTIGQIISDGSFAGPASGFLASSAMISSYGLALTSGATDAKYWDISTGTNTLNFRAVNDANTAQTTWMQVTRSGYGIGGITQQINGGMFNWVINSIGVGNFSSTGLSVLLNNTTANTIGVGTSANFGSNNFEIGISQPSGATHWPFGIVNNGTTVYSIQPDGKISTSATGTAISAPNGDISTGKASIVGTKTESANYTILSTDPAVTIGTVNGVTITLPASDTEGKIRYILADVSTVSISSANLRLGSGFGLSQGRGATFIFHSGSGWILASP